jgi:RNA polymerase sigma-70 factor, ECF subfamily
LDKEAIYSELLVLRCRRHESGAIKELIGHWEDRLFYFVRGLVGDEEDAWDILQETWVKVVRKIGSLENPRSLNAWLYRIARLTAMSHLRDAYSESDKREEAVDTMETVTEPDQLHFDNAEQVHYGLKRLTLPHREMLTLHFLEDMPVDEIAEVLDIPPGTVKSRLYYAKRALGAVLEGC